MLGGYYDLGYVLILVLVSSGDEREVRGWRYVCRGRVLGLMGWGLVHLECLR